MQDKMGSSCFISFALGPISSVLPAANYSDMFGFVKVTYKIRRLPLFRDVVYISTAEGICYVLSYCVLHSK